MARSRNALQKIKDEIAADPRGRGYAGKSPAEIAILMSEPISKAVPVFTTKPLDIAQVFAERLSPTRLATLRDLSITQGFLALGDFSLTTETKVARGDDLQLGEITQGDAEEALRLL